ncbi:hypothetical protein DXG01_004753 [Tephrocybe rancida]|nr:hypothetical protein DXG01_004753 [Tephrocybe rancida]
MGPSFSTLTASYQNPWAVVNRILRYLLDSGAGYVLASTSQTTAWDGDGYDINYSDYPKSGWAPRPSSLFPGGCPLPLTDLSMMIPNT